MADDETTLEDGPDEEDWSDVYAAQPWREPFLRSLATGCAIHAAAEAAGIGFRTVYKHRQRYERFALAWADAYEAGTDTLEEEALRRAVQGVETPVMSGGAPVFLVDPVTGVEVPMTVRKYSDVLLIFLLKGRRPQKFRDNVRIEQTGADGGPVKVAVQGPRSEERIRELARIAVEAGFLDDAAE